MSPLKRPVNVLVWCTAELVDREWFVEFHETEREAKRVAEAKIKDAADSGESCEIYVLKSEWTS